MTAGPAGVPDNSLSSGWEFYCKHVESCRVSGVTEGWVSLDVSTCLMKGINRFVREIREFSTERVIFWVGLA